MNELPTSRMKKLPHIFDFKWCKQIYTSSLVTSRGADLDKRHKLEDKMNEVLGWTGLGHCDGGSIGSGSMEACCFVVDFDVAKNVIEKILKGTELENYTKIYDENAE